MEALRGQNFKNGKRGIFKAVLSSKFRSAALEDLQKACYERHWQLISILQQSVNMPKTNKKTSLVMRLIKFTPQMQ